MIKLPPADIGDLLKADQYYIECNRVFRLATTQGAIMLQMLMRLVPRRRSLDILSVGSGVGLFEIPMLEQFIRVGIQIRKFVGVDSNALACTQLEHELRSRFDRRIESEVIHSDFQDLRLDMDFDMILFNHMFEYLRKQHLTWIQKSSRLLVDKGKIYIFSPDLGGINQPYAQIRQLTVGAPPFFSADVQAVLEQNRIPFDSFAFQADCDISLLNQPVNHPDKIRLLSFLTQMDCRSIRTRYIDDLTRYFQGLTWEGSDRIPHPGTLFVILGSEDPPPEEKTRGEDPRR